MVVSATMHLVHTFLLYLVLLLHSFVCCFTFLFLVIISFGVNLYNVKKDLNKYGENC
jgi:hypothetical protein